MRRKIFILASSASVVRQALIDISNSGTIGETAVHFHSNDYHDLLSKTYDELIEEVTRSDEGDAIDLRTTWLASLMKVFVSSYALGPVDTFIQLSAVVAMARTGIAPTGTHGGKNERFLKKLISVEMNLISEIEKLYDHRTDE